MPVSKGPAAMKETPGSWLRQPALHFVVLGGLIFGLHSVVAEPQTNPNVIEVTAVRLHALQGELARQLGREPTPVELDAMLEQHIHFEILVREAIALELDQGDTVIRRRLIQKMEFLIQDLAIVEQPTDEVLEAFMEEHSERYRRLGTVTFQHLFFRRESDADEVEREARSALEAALRGDSLETMGDPFPLGQRFVGRTSAQVTSVLGRGFAEAIFSVEEGVWTGPVPSRFGLHVVRVEEQRAAWDPPLEDVRARVRGDWLEERRDEANRVARHRMRRRYDIRIATVDRSAVRASETEDAEVVR